jgi:hypothetical protein
MARQKGNAPRKNRPRRAQQKPAKSDYYVQPGKRGAVIVLRKPCGNRAIPKVCGVMPTRAHAKALVTQLEKAESVVSDLFLEATDDGIEALEAVLAACREDVLKRMPVPGHRGRPTDRDVDDEGEEPAMTQRASGE